MTATPYQDLSIQYQKDKNVKATLSMTFCSTRQRTCLIYCLPISLNLKTKPASQHLQIKRPNFSWFNRIKKHMSTFYSSLTHFAVTTDKSNKLPGILLNQFVM